MAWLATQERTELKMSALTQVSHDPTENQFEIRRRRLLFRCWHRGTQESDLILGSFAEDSLETLMSDQLGRLEALRGYMGVIRRGGQLLIRDTFPVQRVFESLGGLVDQAGVAIGALDGGFRRDP